MVDDHFKTNIEGIYAIGIYSGTNARAQGCEEAVACVEMLATGYGHISTILFPVWSIPTKSHR